ncbi:MAG TPA: restriction endonuclease subunit S [Prolixibacteraceae bacterium]|nr:restriction endonuclease subunit S [Prolixibacteraceae bacterium]
MNKVEELIGQLCPEGVEFKALGDCASILRGRRVTKSELNPDKKYPVYSGGVTPMGYFDKYNQSPNTITVVKYGTAGFVNFIKENFWANDVCYCVKPSDTLVNKYLFYILKFKQDFIQSQATNAIPAHLPTDAFERIPIPIPPLPIQQEIVTILDKFTQLEAELEAEREARKRQYEYYLNQLFDFEGKNVEWKTLGDVGEFIRGNGLQKKDFTDSGVGCIHYGQIYTYYGTYTYKTKSFVVPELAKKLKKAEKGNLVIAATSENIEDVCKAVAWLGDGAIAISGDAYVYRHRQNPKYIAYYYMTEMFFNQKKKYVSGTKVIRVSGNNMAKITIPIPPLGVQQYIVSILDKFDALVNDISVGLPAEIQARHKQYEYYRGKLLNFKDINNG